MNLGFALLAFTTLATAQPAATRVEIIHSDEVVMDMIRVSSSAIAAVGYDADKQRMKIRFTTGGTYDYCRVPLSVFEGLLKSSSKGTFFSERISGRYQC